MQPEIYARALLERLAIADVPDVLSIASSLHVPIREKALERCDGMLVRIQGTAKGIIAVKSSIREASRKLFTIAHELGHLFLPGHDEYGICAAEDIESWSKTLRDKEREANAFAAELLMPLALVNRLVGSTQPAFGPIERIAGTFHTSLTASGYRFMDVTSHSCALVWSQDRRVRWAKRSPEFRHWLRVREGVDPRTLAADLFEGKQVPVGPHPIPADAWLETNTGSEATILEESRFLPAYRAVLTLLWAKDPIDSRDDDVGLLESLDPTEFSINRQRWPTKRGR